MEKEKQGKGAALADEAHCTEGFGDVLMSRRGMPLRPPQRPQRRE